MTTMMTKRTALHDLCKTTLEAHRSGLRTATYFRNADDPRRDRADRVRVMGDPCWYMEVLHEATEAEGTVVSGGKWLLAYDRFRVYVWFAYADAPTYAASSQSTWDTMMHGQEDGAEGLIYTLTQAVAVGDSPTRKDTLQQQGIVTGDVVPLDMGGKELAHFCTFTIDLEG